MGTERVDFALSRKISLQILCLTFEKNEKICGLRRLDFVRPYVGWYLLLAKKRTAVTPEDYVWPGPRGSQDLSLPLSFFLNSWFSNIAPRCNISNGNHSNKFSGIKRVNSVSLFSLSGITASKYILFVHEIPCSPYLLLRRLSVTLMFREYGRIYRGEQEIF